MFVKGIRRGETLIQNFKKLLAELCFQGFGKWWVIIEYFSASLLLSGVFRLGFGVFELVFVSSSV